MADVRHVAVAVPARDEEAHVGACLRAVSTAVGALHASLPLSAAVEVQVVVVVNGTRDRTASLARAQGAQVLVRAEPGVGAARGAGAAHALTGRDPRTTWLACTDADSVVPRDWLVEHVRLAAEGADAVVGTIRLPGERLVEHPSWWRRYERDLSPSGHPHVHGANLGVRGAAYLAVGGFAALDAHEDADLVGRLDAGGHRVVRTDAAPVVTSDRTRGRAPAGVAADLRAWRSRPPA